MPSIREIAQDIVAREGGFVEDPADPGGATKHGVTIHTLRRLGLDLDRDGDIDRQDVQRVSVALAVEIFLRDYFEKPNLGALPAALQPTVFDMQVNAGARAVKILQRLVTKMGMPCVPDGVIGPKTIAAVQAAYGAAQNYLVDAYGIERRNYYFALADRQPALRKFCRTQSGGKGGWITRAETFISARFHMTRTQFRERIAQWG